jgi:DMSO reductase family type II enzyme chaperone
MRNYMTEELAIEAARETIYRFLASVLRHPSLSLAELRNGRSASIIRAAADLLREPALNDPIPLGPGELSAESLDVDEVVARWQGPPDDLFAEFDRAFGVGSSTDCPPYETEFCANREPFYRAQQMADVSGFYRAFGLVPSRRMPERADHLALELEFMAILQMKQRLAAEGPDADREEFVGICQQAQYDFLNEHLCWWVPSFATGLRRKAADGPYAAVAKVLAAFLPTERQRFGIKAPQMPVRPRSVERPEEQTDCEGCTPVAE